MQGGDVGRWSDLQMMPWTTLNQWSVKVVTPLLLILDTNAAVFAKGSEATKGGSHLREALELCQGRYACLGRCACLGSIRPVSFIWAMKPNHSRQDTATAVVTAAAVGTAAAAVAAAQQQPLPLLLVVQSALVYSVSSPPFPRPCIAIARCECDRARALRVQSTVRRLEPLEPPLVSKTKADR